jgi:hypothetical protein
MRQLIRASPRAPRGCNKHLRFRVVLERLLSRPTLFRDLPHFSSSLDREALGFSPLVEAGGANSPVSKVFHEGRHSQGETLFSARVCALPFCNPDLRSGWVWSVPIRALAFMASNLQQAPSHKQGNLIS